MKYTLLPNHRKRPLVVQDPSYFTELFKKAVKMITVDKSIPEQFIDDAAQDFVLVTIEHLEKYRSTWVGDGYLYHLYRKRRQLLQKIYSKGGTQGLPEGNMLEHFKVYESPDIGLYLYDAERLVDKYRFPAYITLEDSERIKNEAKRLIYGNPSEENISAARILARWAILETVGYRSFVKREFRCSNFIRTL